MPHASVPCCSVGAPCLSFAVLPDALGERRETFPLTCYLVAGTQGERAHLSNVIVMKMSNLQRTTRPPKGDGEMGDDESESDDEDEDGKPELDTAMIRHVGAVNRIRVHHENLM